MKRQLLLSIISFLLCFICNAQVTFVVKKIPKDSAKTDIYISGDFENWSGGQDKYRLKRFKNFYSITLPPQEGTINYKFTKGSWKTVETDLDNNAIENRFYLFNRPDDTVYVEIKNWNNEEILKSTASKNVKIFHKDLNIPQLKRKRRIWVYLPPGYETSKENYPVLYMQDGQNLFDNSTAFSEEWEVDEILNRLALEKNLKLIVVGIDNGSNHRLNEYSPWKNNKYGGGEGDAYVRFIVETLKPKIDSSYRTKKKREYTAIMGSSMGGLISYYGAFKYPQVFGKVGVFSPSFWFSDKVINFTEEHGDNAKIKAYFLMGTEEGKNAIEAFDKVIEALKKSGFEKKSFAKKMVVGGKHNEAFWKREFEEAIYWLFK